MEHGPENALSPWRIYFNELRIGIVLRNHTEKSHGNMGRTENILQAVSIYTAVDVLVDLHCEVLPISCSDTRIPALAARQVFPQSKIAYNVFTNMNSRSTTRSPRIG